VSAPQFMIVCCTHIQFHSHQVIIATRTALRLQCLQNVLARFPFVHCAAKAIVRCTWQACALLSIALQCKVSISLMTSL
jgi:hypothetical protein